MNLGKLLQSILCHSASPLAEVTLDVLASVCEVQSPSVDIMSKRGEFLADYGTERRELCKLGKE